MTHEIVKYSPRGKPTVAAGPLSLADATFAVYGMMRETLGVRVLVDEVPRDDGSVDFYGHGPSKSGPYGDKNPLRITMRRMPS